MLLGGKLMIHLDSLFKIRDIVLPKKVHAYKAMVFLVVMYGCMSWAIKKARHQRIAFLLWCWRRLLRVPWTARRSNQSILKEIRPEYSLERLMLKLKLQCFGLLMWRNDSFEYTLKLAKTEGRRRSWQQKIRWLVGITDLLDMSLSKFCVSVMYKEAWYMAVHGALTCRRQLNDWTKCLVYMKEESFRAGLKTNISKSCRGW